MIKKNFWENIADVWARKEKIEIPDIDLADGPPPDDPEEDYIDFDDIDDIDDFFKDILNDI